MSQFRDGIRKARGSLVFLLGITLAFGTVFGLERWQPEKANTMAAAGAIDLDKSDSVPLRDHRALNEAELSMARVAWTYFISKFC